MHRPTSEPSEEQADAPVVHTLDGRLADLLAAIEEESVPDRLLRLAQQLQAELARRKLRLNPN